MSKESRRPIFAFAFVLALLALGAVLPRPVVAGDTELRGRLFLGEHLDLVIELRESFIKEGFRWLGLLNEPRPRINLSRLGSKGDRLFFALDGKLYCSRRAEGGQKGEIYQVGEPVSILDIRLEPGVKLLRSSPRGLDFTGTDEEKLKVAAPPRLLTEAETRKASYYYWLDELAYAYDDDDGSGRRKDQAYERLEASLRNVLPFREDDSLHRLENLKLLRKYVETENPEKLPPLLPLVEGKIRQLQERMQADGADAAFYEPILKVYRQLAVQLREKTYDM